MREEFWNMADIREEGGIWEYGREEGREGGMGIWQRGGKREEHGFIK